MEWLSVDTQEQLDQLDGSVCWEDDVVLEYYGTPAIAVGLPTDVSRSGYALPNVYVLIDTLSSDPRYLELALIHCDDIAHSAFEAFRLSGLVDALKRVVGQRFRCARIAYKRLESANDQGFYFGAKYLSDGAT